MTANTSRASTACSGRLAVRGSIGSARSASVSGAAVGRRRGAS